MTGIIHDPSLTAEQMRERLLRLFPAPTAARLRSCADMVREDLVANAKSILELFSILMGMTFEEQSRSIR